MAKAKCPHKTLKKQLTGGVSWYVCAIVGPDGKLIANR